MLSRCCFFLSRHKVGISRPALLGFREGVTVPEARSPQPSFDHLYVRVHISPVSTVGTRRVDDAQVRSYPYIWFYFGSREGVAELSLGT